MSSIGGLPACWTSLGSGASGDAWRDPPLSRTPDDTPDLSHVLQRYFQPLKQVLCTTSGAHTYSRGARIMLCLHQEDVRSFIRSGNAEVGPPLRSFVFGAYRRPAGDHRDTDAYLVGISRP
jgi:hypothetical protein